MDEENDRIRILGIVSGGRLRNDNEGTLRFGY